MKDNNCHRLQPETGSELNDDDGLPKRRGTVWTASARITTGTIGSAVLSLPWVVAQLGWVAGPIVIFVFALLTYYASTLLAGYYRSGDTANAGRSYTYMDAVRGHLGGVQVKICGWVQYLNLFGVAIGITITASLSMLAIPRTSCFNKSGGNDPCHTSPNLYIIAFGVVEIILSQVQDFDQISWLPVTAAGMSCIYSTIGFGLGIAKVADNGKLGGSLTGIRIGNVTQAQKVWRTFQALGVVSFTSSYSMILIEVQNTLRSSPSEVKTMKRVNIISVAVSTLFALLCGCMDYAAFGDSAPRNLLAGVGFHNPYWLLDIANAAIVLNQVIAYQLYTRPLFAFIEKSAAHRYPDCRFITKEVPIPGYKSYSLNLFRLVWRTVFVIITTIIAMLLPLYNVVGLLRVLGYWPLTIYYPVKMHIQKEKIPKWSTKWVCLLIISGASLIISIAATAGSVSAVVVDLKGYKPFGTSY